MSKLFLMFDIFSDVKKAAVSLSATKTISKVITLILIIWHRFSAYFTVPWSALIACKSAEDYKSNYKGVPRLLSDDHGLPRNFCENKGGPSMYIRDVPTKRHSGEERSKVPFYLASRLIRSQSAQHILLLLVHIFTWKWILAVSQANSSWPHIPSTKRPWNLLLFLLTQIVSSTLPASFTVQAFFLSSFTWLAGLHCTSPRVHWTLGMLGLLYPPQALWGFFIFVFSSHPILMPLLSTSCGPVLGWI